MFRERWIEAKDGWVRRDDEVGVGTPDVGIPRRTDAREWVVAPGLYQFPPFGPVEGTPQQWAEGTLYADYVLGKYGPMQGCVSVTLPFTLTDTATVLIGGGKGAGPPDVPAVALLADADSLEADVETGGYLDVAQVDADSLLVPPMTGGSPSLVLADRDTLNVDVATAGATVCDLRDKDSLAVNVETGGGVPSGVADADTLTADWRTGGEPSVTFADADTLLCTGEVSSSGEDGLTCATAIEIPSGATTEITIGAMEHRWYWFVVEDGDPYACIYTFVSGDSTVGVTLKHGTCPSPTSEGAMGDGECKDFTGGPDEKGFFEVIGGTIGSTTLTLNPYVGFCP